MSLQQNLDHLDEISRRKFLGLSAKAFLGVGLSSILGPGLFGAGEAEAVRPARRTARNVIYLYLNGGMSHLDTFDPRENTASMGGPSLLNTKVDGLRLSQYLPTVAAHADKLAIINSMHSTQGAHERGNYYMHTSYEQRATTKHPGLGAWLNKLSGKTNSTLPGNVRIGGGNTPGSGAGYFETRYAPLHIGKPEDGLQNSTRHHKMNELAFKERLELSEWLDQSFAREYSSKELTAHTDMYSEALSLMQSKDLLAFDVSKEPRNLREAYGEGRFGQGCLLARRLVENGVRFVEVQLGGWDTHVENFDRVGELCQEFDMAYGALLEDLHQRGMLDETLVVVGTEFGRTPELNANEGRDHHPQAFSTVLAGGGIRGGQVYGKTDASGHNVDESLVTVPDFNATIAYALGLPLDKVLYSPDGRPFTIADKGSPVIDLF